MSAAVLRTSRRRRSFWSHSALLCALAAGATAAVADDAGTVLLPPWIVEETLFRVPRAGREDAFAATLGPNAVVDPADWSGRPIVTLADALRRAPGVMLQESFGGFEPPRISIRGSGLDSAPTSRGLAMLVDGLPLARADGSFQSALIDPALFDRVEIYRGTLHTALTPSAVGGVVHAVTAFAGAGHLLRSEIGEWGTWRGQWRQEMRDGRVAVSLARSDGWREQSAQQRGAFNAALRRPLSDTARLRLSIYAGVAEYEVPGPLTWRELWTAPREVSAAVRRDRPWRKSAVVRGSADASVAVSDWRGSGGIALQRLHDDFRQLQANGETDGASDDVSAYLGFSRRLLLGGMTHEIVSRLTAAGGQNRVDRLLNDDGRRGPSFGRYDARAASVAGSVEDLVRVTDTLVAGAGVTALQARRDLRERGGVSGVGRVAHYQAASPRAGLQWQPTGQTALHAGISRGVEPPTFDDMIAVAGSAPNLALRSRDLRAQEATTIEAGVTGAIGPLSWSVTGYRADWRNEILRLADAAGNPRGAVSAGRTIHTGVESAVRWNIRTAPFRLWLTGSSTIGRFYFAGDPVYGRNRLAGSPPHVGTVELAGESRRGIFGGVESTWAAGRTWVDHAGRMSYGGHTLVDARAGWRSRHGFTVFFAARNFLDRAHIASTAGVLDLVRSPASTAIFLPGVARNLNVGVEWRGR